VVRRKLKAREPCSDIEGEESGTNKKRANVLSQGTEKAIYRKCIPVVENPGLLAKMHNN
jgi:hypothetical protein